MVISHQEILKNLFIKSHVIVGNAFSEEGLINFEKNKKFLSIQNDFKIYYSAEPKIDGISASLTYKNGKFYKGLSRGDGEEGEEITENLKTINDIPKKISNKDFPEEIDIRGEVFIQNSDFKNLNEKFANLEMQHLVHWDKKSRRNKKYLSNLLLTFGYEKGLKINNQFDYLKKLNEWGFKTNPLNILTSGIKT